MKILKLLLLGLMFIGLFSCRHETPERIQPTLMLASGAEPSQSEPENPTGPQSVYVCKSPGAKRYHLSENCRGLKRCTHSVETTTAKKAEAVGLTLCKFEN